MKCVHHWRISEPDGSHFVIGRCQKCRATRTFKTVIPEILDFHIKRDRSRLNGTAAW